MRRRGDNFPDNGFEAWGGYMQAKISKLEDQFCQRAEKENQLSNIFNGVSIFVNGYTRPSADELKALMSEHGGVYHTYQRSEDFIIATNLPDTKVKKLSLAKVVRPEWITDSIAADRLLDYRSYLLYKNSRTQLCLNFNKVKDELTLDNNDSHDTTSKPTVTTSSCNTEVCKSNIIDENLNRISESKKVNNNTKTAADPNFIMEFYNNSRLHHISQLGACFKQHVNDLREKSNFQFPARIELKEKISLLNNNVLNVSPLHFEGDKIIMHIDMDCFFVSVGLRNRPDLRGKPVAVTHSKGGQGRIKRFGVDRNAEFNLYKQKQAVNLGKSIGDNEVVFETRVDNIGDEDDKYGSMSEIASCSYEARAKGVSNGMFMGAALRLCPDIQTIPYDFDGYKDVSYTLYNTIAQYTLDIEAVSCDEMYVDCSEIIKSLNVTVQDFATALRNEIKIKTGCPCSTGFGSNRLQARLATKRAKPNGQFFLTADLVEDFIYDIKLKDLPGVGRQIAHKLETLGHQTCGSLQSLSLGILQQHLGNKTGSQLFDQCRGRDPNFLTFHTVRKSVSAEVNYGIRFENNDQCIEFLKQLSAEVHSRMNQFKVLGKCITLKLMVRAQEAPLETAKFMGHGFCDIINKSTSLTNATSDLNIITKEVISLCNKQNIDPKEMRGIGIQVTKLESVNTKPRTGAMNKFLCNNKALKHENKTENVKHLERTSCESEIEFETKPKFTTPKKIRTSGSPDKKSPIIGFVKSPGKRRGRPPKNSKLQVSTSKNLMNKFLLGQTVVRDILYKDPMIKDTEVIPIQSAPPKQKEKPGLLGLPWDKVREFLRAWLESGQNPLPCDIKLIASYMREMVLNKNLEQLIIILNFLKRRTREINTKEWVQVNNHVIEQVQNAMIAVYGRELMI